MLESFGGSLHLAVQVDTEEWTVAVDAVEVRRIVKAIAAADVSVTYQAPRSTYLHVVNYLLQRLEELLLAHVPTCRESREGAVAVAFGEGFAAVVSDVELSHIAVVPVVSDTSYNTQRTFRYQVVVAAGVIGLLLVVKQECRYGVQTKLAVPAEAGVKVPVT